MHDYYIEWRPGCGEFGQRMLTLGINSSQMHDSAACLVWDGELLFAVAKERLSRSNLENMISVSDLALARRLDSKRVQEDLEATIQQATIPGRNVYFYSLFDESSGSPSDIYETRFRLRGFTDFLRGVERKTNRLQG